MPAKKTTRKKAPPRKKSPAKRKPATKKKPVVRKPAVKRKPATKKKAAVRKPAVKRKPATKKKPTVRKTATKKPAVKAEKKKAQKLQNFLKSFQKELDGYSVKYKGIPIPTTAEHWALLGDDKVAKDKAWKVKDTALGTKSLKKCIDMVLSGKFDDVDHPASHAMDYFSEYIEKGGQAGLSDTASKDNAYAPLVKAAHMRKKSRK